jgi:hypothetical protein
MYLCNNQDAHFSPKTKNKIRALRILQQPSKSKYICPYRSGMGCPVLAFEITYLSCIVFLLVLLFTHCYLPCGIAHYLVAEGPLVYLLNGACSCCIKCTEPASFQISMVLPHLSHGATKPHHHYRKLLNLRGPK